jgi:hypothetical protein
MPDFRDITVSQSVRFCDGSHIGNDILLLDEVSKIPIPREPRRMDQSIKKVLSGRKVDDIKVGEEGEQA